jgi:uncharacterized membrane protein
MQSELQSGRNYGPLVAAGVLLGIGLGGFLDGILFHQILQLHNMLSAVRPKTTLVNMEINMFWDGLFHALTWTMTALGLGMLWAAVRREDVPLSTRAFVGSMVLGWGLFNLVEGIIDHHLLNLHHVVERLGVSVYDYAFLGSGVLFILLGWRLIRADQNAAEIAPAARPGQNRGLVG